MGFGEAANSIEGGKGLGIETWLLRLGVSNQANNMQLGIGEGVEK